MVVVVVVVVVVKLVSLTCNLQEAKLPFWLNKYRLNNSPNTD